MATKKEKIQLPWYYYIVMAIIYSLLRMIVIDILRIQLSPIVSWIAVFITIGLMYDIAKTMAVQRAKRLENEAYRAREKAKQAENEKTEA